MFMLISDRSDHDELDVKDEAMHEQINPDRPSAADAGTDQPTHAWLPPLGQAPRRPAASPTTHSSRVRRLAAGAGAALVGAQSRPANGRI